ncbi:MAG: phosphoglycerate dehydrogenase [Candidatus Omnitrophica bacterium]|nr:phosphoglycerate dehydrogenase [Candidatus Omnitrophota bacterium]
MKKIFISTSSFGEFDQAPIKLLRDAGFETGFNPYGRSLVKDEIVKLASDAEGLIAGTEPLGSDNLSKMRNLKVISRCGVGMDNVDLKAAKSLGVKVFNTPDAPTIAVAELTIGMILDLLRRISQMDREIRSGRWKKRMGSLLSGKSVGIIGFGRIGRKAAELLKPFNCKLGYYDIDDSASRVKNPDVKKLGLDELLKASDIVLLHVSNSGGGYIMGENEIKKMKKGALIVNVSRGEALDEKALCGALKDGRLSGAALDVFEKEPYEGELKGMENVILTPHIGSYAREARAGMEMEAAKNLLKGLEDTK